PIYYLSKKKKDYEVKYNQVEKTCLALVWATRKLRHHFQSYKVKEVSRHDPLKYLHETPSLTGKLARCLVLLSEFDIEYLTKKAVKGRAVAEFLAQSPVADNEPWNLEFPDEHMGAIEEVVF